MPRQARLDAPGPVYHVMIRGIGWSPIFKEDQDRHDFISRAGILARETGTRVRAEISYHFSHEFGISKTEIARQLGECTSVIAKTIQKIEVEGSKC